MAGDDRVRFCSECRKNVYNLSAMTGVEAEALLIRHEGQICKRFYRREDGAVLTADRLVASGRRLRRAVALGAMGGSLVAAVAAVGGCNITISPGPNAEPAAGADPSPAGEPTATAPVLPAVVAPAASLGDVSPGRRVNRHGVILPEAVVAPTSSGSAGGAACAPSTSAVASKRKTAKHPYVTMGF
jgi:hypothetical protein